MVPTVMDYSLALRISSVFILFFASLAGIIIPSLLSGGSSSQTNESHRKMCESDAFRITRTFAAGIMLAVGVIHLLADGVAKLAAVSLEYPPLGYTLATVGALLVLAFEQVAVMLIGSVKEDGDSAKSIAVTEKNVEADFGTGPVDIEVLETLGHESTSTSDHNHAIKMIAATDSLNVIVKAYMMEISIAIHSVIIGIALGGLVGKDEITTLIGFIIAICFHQFFEGVGLGTVIESARLQLGTTKIIIFILLFALTVPAGIVIGIVTSGDELPPAIDTTTGDLIPGIADLNIAQEYTLGCLNSIAAGTKEIGLECTKFIFCIIHKYLDKFCYSVGADRAILLINLFIDICLLIISNRYVDLRGFC